MKIFNVRFLTLFAFVIIVLAVVFGFLITNRASASLGNEGTPVRCDADVSPGFYDGLLCYYSNAPDQNFSTIPTGYYLLITDIDIFPTSPEASTGINFVIIANRAGGSDDLINSITYRTDATYGNSYHYNTPYFIILPGDHVRITNTSISANNVQVFISGLLVTNATYLPLVSR